MDFWNILWVFFLVVAMQPMARQRLLEISRRKLISKIERERGSRLILLVHRQETMSLLGFPVMRFIDIEDSEAIIHAIQLTNPDTPIDLVLHTPGGLVLASYQIARALNRRKGKVTVYVPHYAMSGGTLIALAADEIVMCDHAVLGPLDPQVGQFPAASLLKVVRDKPMKDIDDETLILADQAAKAVRQLDAIVHEMLEGRYTPEQIDQLATQLTQGAWTHDYPITCDEAKRLGLHVQTDMPLDMLRLMTLFPQPLRRTPSVEAGERPYPVPYRRRAPETSE